MEKKEMVDIKNLPTKISYLYFCPDLYCISYIPADPLGYNLAISS